MKQKNELQKNYERQLDRIAAAQSIFRDKLHVHKYLVSYDGYKDYGYVGDLSRIADKLEEVNEFLRFGRYDFKLDSSPEE